MLKKATVRGGDLAGVSNMPVHLMPDWSEADLDLPQLARKDRPNSCHAKVRMKGRPPAAPPPRVGFALAPCLFQKNLKSLNLKTAQSNTGPGPKKKLRSEGGRKHQETPQQSFFKTERSTCYFLTADFVVSVTYDHRAQRYLLTPLVPPPEDLPYRGLLSLLPGPSISGPGAGKETHLRPTFPEQSTGRRRVALVEMKFEHAAYHRPKYMKSTGRKKTTVSAELTDEMRSAMIPPQVRPLRRPDLQNLLAAGNAVRDCRRGGTDDVRQAEGGGIALDLAAQTQSSRSSDRR
ncbi:hypothetical protein TYRP_023303 [Tyrophagus putrescentiae]|nr:hypothetical protein TYRP_023303 [Tyrophagus putrescentiae]